MFLITQGFGSELLVTQGFGAVAVPVTPPVVHDSPGPTVGGGPGWSKPESIGHYVEWKARQQDEEILELVSIITQVLA